MLIDGANYTPSLSKFINKFSNNVRTYPKENIDYLEQLFGKFLEICKPIGKTLFLSKSSRFNISVFESIFTACCGDAFKEKNLDVKPPIASNVELLKSDIEFIDATQYNTASTTNVAMRLNRAKQLLFV